MIAASLREAYQRRAGDSWDGPDPMLKAAYESLQDQEGEDNTEKDLMRKSIYLVVWTCASQTRNELKKKAKQVVEAVFQLGVMNVAQRNEAAKWLLESHPAQATGGMRNVPNFIFGGIKLWFNSNKVMDPKLTKIRRNEPFRTVCIPDLIYQYYGLAGRGEASVTAALDEFRKVPLNLIALACNAIESALMEVAPNSQPNVFSNKHYAAKWDGLMAVLEVLEKQAGEYLKETQKLIWKRVSENLNCGAGDDTSDNNNKSGGIIPLLDLRPTNATDLQDESSDDEPTAGPSVAGPSAASAAGAASAVASSSKAPTGKEKAPHVSAKATHCRHRDKSKPTGPASEVDELEPTDVDSARADIDEEDDGEGGSQGGAGDD
ncbi:hypothetical protein FOMPIDRAFT_94186 [Fomitopsis schrenkii]|uniref:DUF6532 domain-containing protein n=1 Tax=Fomitopsis schrenkii TaxID=2126942 RepID=S8E061_FOMSC|nr:hypothetical protein FOMPIDRAFT_94186 [Fomitopsis schrenkii]